MRTTFAVASILGAMASLSPAMAQERLPTPITVFIAREAARLGIESTPAARNASAPAPRATGSRPSQPLERGNRIRVATTVVAKTAASCDAGGQFPARGEDSPTFRGPDTARLTTPRPVGPIIGRFEGWDGQTLTVLCDNGSAVSIPRGAIARLERLDGTSSRAKAVSTGVLIGIAVGGGGGALVGLSGCASLGHATMCSRGLFPVGILVGAGIGAMAGASVELPDAWTEIDMGTLDKSPGTSAALASL